MKKQVCVRPWPLRGKELLTRTIISFPCQWQQGLSLCKYIKPWWRVVFKVTIMVERVTLLFTQKKRLFQYWDWYNNVVIIELWYWLITRGLGWECPQVLIHRTRPMNITLSSCYQPFHSYICSMTLLRLNLTHFPSWNFLWRSICKA